MKITITPDGDFSVTEIPDNPMVAFGILKMAEISVTQMFLAKEQEKRIQPVTMLPPGLGPRLG